MDSVGRWGQYPSATTLHEQSRLDGARSATTPQEQSGPGGPAETIPTPNHPACTKTRQANADKTHRSPPYKSRMDSVGQRGQDPPDTTLQEQNGLGGPISKKHHENTNNLPTEYPTHIKKRQRTYQEHVHHIPKTYHEIEKKMPRKHLPNIQHIKARGSALTAQVRQPVMAIESRSQRQRKPWVCH